MSKVGIFYNNCIRSNPYYKFDKGVFTKWETVLRPYTQISVGTAVTSLELSDDVIINIDAWVYSLSIKLKREKEFLANGRLPGTKDYPVCVAGCCDKKNVNLIALNYVPTKNKNDVQYNERMIDLFIEKLGKMPYSISTETNCNFPIGNCAEQRVVNDLISHHAEIEIRISKAIRPRTMVFVQPCENCKRLFDL